MSGRPWLAEYPSHVPADVDAGRATGLSLFNDAVAARPEGLAIISGERRLTYADLDTASDGLALGLIAVGRRTRAAVLVREKGVIAPRPGVDGGGTWVVGLPSGFKT